MTTNLWFIEIHQHVPSVKLGNSWLGTRQNTLLKTTMLCSCKVDQFNQI